MHIIQVNGIEKYLQRVLGYFIENIFAPFALDVVLGQNKKENNTMNIQNTTSANFITENKNRIIFLFVLFLLSSFRMFGQTPAVEVVAGKDVVVVSPQVKNDLVSIDTQIDFVGWFMGSRQSINEDEPAGNSKAVITKKQILTSGITPNKVLYRTFMKRVISQDSAVV